MRARSPRACSGRCARRATRSSGPTSCSSATARKRRRSTRARPLPVFDDLKPGEIRGWLMGVGGDTPRPIPRTDEEGRAIGYWRSFEVMQLDVTSSNRSAHDGSEHLSSLREPYLSELARRVGFDYARLTGLESIGTALRDTRFAQRRPVPTELNWLPILAALVLLALHFRPDRNPSRDRIAAPTLSRPLHRSPDPHRGTGDRPAGPREASRLSSASSRRRRSSCCSSCTACACHARTSPRRSCTGGCTSRFSRPRSFSFRCWAGAREGVSVATAPGRCGGRAVPVRVAIDGAVVDRVHLDGARQRRRHRDLRRGVEPDRHRADAGDRRLPRPGARRRRLALGRLEDRRCSCCCPSCSATCAGRGSATGPRGARACWRSRIAAPSCSRCTARSPPP